MFLFHLMTILLLNYSSITKYLNYLYKLSTLGTTPDLPASRSARPTKWMSDVSTYHSPEDDTPPFETELPP